MRYFIIVVSFYYPSGVLFFQYFSCFHLILNFTIDHSVFFKYYLVRVVRKILLKV